MLIPQLSLVLAVISILMVLVVSLFIWSVRRNLQLQLQDLRQEARANNSATYGLTRHIRLIQAQIDQAPRHRSPGSVSFAEADKLVDKGIDTLQLANELGVSQNEAELITHMRPGRYRQAKSF